MSVDLASAFAGTVEPKFIKPAGTSIVDFVVNDAVTRSFLYSVLIANNSGSAAVGSVYLNDGTINWLIFAKSVGANDSVQLTFDAIPLPIFSGRKLSVKSGTGGSLEFTAILTTMGQSR